MHTQESQSGPPPCIGHSRLTCANGPKFLSSLPSNLPVSHPFQCLAPLLTLLLLLPVLVTCQHRLMDTGSSASPKSPSRAQQPVHVREYAFVWLHAVGKVQQDAKKPFATASSRMMLFRRALWLASCGRDSTKMAHSMTMTMTCAAEQLMSAHVQALGAAISGSDQHACNDTTLDEQAVHEGMWNMANSKNILRIGSPGQTRAGWLSHWRCAGTPAQARESSHQY